MDINNNNIDDVPPLEEVFCKEDILAEALLIMLVKKEVQYFAIGDSFISALHSEIDILLKEPLFQIQLAVYNEKSLSKYGKLIDLSPERISGKTYEYYYLSPKVTVSLVLLILKENVYIYASNREASKDLTFPALWKCNSDHTVCRIHDNSSTLLSKLPESTFCEVHQKYLNHVEVEKWYLEDKNQVYKSWLRVRVDNNLYTKEEEKFEHRLSDVLKPSISYLMEKYRPTESQMATLSVMISIYDFENKTFRSTEEQFIHSLQLLKQGTRATGAKGIKKFTNKLSDQTMVKFLSEL